MYPSVSPSSVEFLSELRGYLDGLDLAAARVEYDHDELEPGPASIALWRQMGEDGWIAVHWPVEYGGQSRDAIDGWLFQEEMARRRVFSGGLTMSSIGPMLLAVGTDEQRRELVPGMRTADVRFAVGYTEPNAGTDLASLSLRADVEGENYRLNGTKLYTTVANMATHLWLAVRTGRGATKYEGITVVVVPVDTPGVTVRPLMTQSGGRTNEVIFEDVIVPRKNTVGGEGEGWAVIRAALMYERIFPFSGVGAQLNELIACVLGSGEGERMPESARSVLTRLVVDTEVARLLAYRAASLSSDSEQGAAVASMNKVWLTELRQRVASSGLSLLGERGVLNVDQEQAPMNGGYVPMYLAATMRRFAGGANEVQREVVARTVLGGSR